MRERKRNRMLNYDYSANNLYFITSPTKYRIHYFGEVENKKMILNVMGEIAHQQWNWLIHQYPYIKSHAFIVMPDHMHAILEINATHTVDVKIKSLSELMGAYKTTTSKRIHLLGYADFAWHRSFHDHIIRNDEEYRYIYDYIVKNPLLWNKK